MSNERKRREEDLVIRLLRRREEHGPSDRLTPRMFAREVIDLLDDDRTLHDDGGTVTDGLGRPISPLDPTGHLRPRNS